MPINYRDINRPLPFRRPEDASVPEAGQQIDSQHSTLDDPLGNDTAMTTPAAGTVVSGIDNRPRVDVNPIGPEQVREARATLRKYKQGKTHLENRIVDDELWWELRHWESIQGGKEKENTASKPKPTSAWLFNSIVNKHADAMDNYPEPLVLPRERGDEQSAKTLSSILPVVMEYNDFEDVYRENWWEKLKHGTAAYGVFWGSKKENGLGDIDIKVIDLLKMFWEPGIQNIQDSRNLFICELVDTDLLDEQYPDHAGKMGDDSGVDIPKYLYQDNVDTTGKSMVVDWYYKKATPDGRTVLHYCKFCCDEVLYASENDPQYRDRGFYDHGKYPIVLDVLFPEKGTPIGFGYVSIAKDPQLYIDELSSNLLRSSMMGSRKRYFASSSTNINLKDFADWNKDIVRVEGELGDTRLMEIPVTPPAPIYAQILQMKIEEMRETSSNREVNSGGASSGVTAGAAIAALQEAGNKVVRSHLRTTYKACADIYKLCIELMRQFYDEARAFRVTGANEGEYEFMNISNQQLQPQPVGMDAEGNTLYRKPIFDLKVQAQKRNPFSTMEGNQRASELYGMGFFNPDRAQEAIGALEMMEFEGIEKVRDTVKQGNTLQNMIIQQNQMIQQLAGMLGLQTGAPAPAAPGGGVPPRGQAGPPSGVSANADTGVPRTSYMNRLAARSAPNMDMAEQAVNPTQR